MVESGVTEGGQNTASFFFFHEHSGIQSTPDNSSLLGKSKKVRVIGSLKQITGNKKKANGWGEDVIKIRNKAAIQE